MADYLLYNTIEDFVEVAENSENQSVHKFIEEAG
jgi:hypothetical protein